MHICMNACKYACMHACMHACMFAYMHRGMQKCMYACIHSCMHAYMHICLHTHSLGPRRCSMLLQVLPDQWHREGAQFHPQLRAAEPREPQVLQLCRGWKVSWKSPSNTTLHHVSFPTLCCVLTTIKLLCHLKIGKFKSFQNLSSRKWYYHSRHSCFPSCLQEKNICFEDEHSYDMTRVIRCVVVALNLSCFAFPPNNRFMTDS